MFWFCLFNPLQKKKRQNPSKLTNVNATPEREDKAEQILISSSKHFVRSKISPANAAPTTPPPIKRAPHIPENVCEDTKTIKNKFKKKICNYYERTNWILFMQIWFWSFKAQNIH